MSKRFLLYWGDGYAVRETRIEGTEFFAEGNGYDEGMQRDIAALDIAQTWLAPIPDFHLVTRIEDREDEAPQPEQAETSIEDELRAILYPDNDPARQWGSDELAALAQLMQRHGLAPKEE